MISKSASSGFIGNNTYSATASGQEIIQEQRRGRSRAFYVRIQNDGTDTNKVTLEGSTNPQGASVVYRHGLLDVTAAIRSTRGYVVTLEPRETVSLQIRTTVKRTAAIGSRKPASVTATWRGDATLKDAVIGIVKVVRSR